MSENMTFSQYYDKANFRSNKRWQRDFSPAGTVTLEIPNQILERKNTAEPFVRYGSSLEHGRWEGYYPSKFPNLDQKVMVARSPIYPLQRIVGPEYFIHNVMFSYYLLDMLYPNNPFHNMDLVASVAFDEKGNVNNPKRLLWTNDLLDSLGVDMLQTRFQKRDENNPCIGIACDVEWPTFYMYYDLRIDSGKSRAITSIVQAEAIIHDWTHVEQERLGYTSSCFNAEIQAISNQLRFAEAIYNNPGFFNPDIFSEWRPHRITKNYAESIRQGLALLDSFKNGGTGHLLDTSDWSEKDLEFYRKSNGEYLPIDIFR